MLIYNQKYVDFIWFMFLCKNIHTSSLPELPWVEATTSHHITSRYSQRCTFVKGKNKTNRKNTATNFRTVLAFTNKYATSWAPVVCVYCVYFKTRKSLVGSDLKRKSSSNWIQYNSKSKQTPKLALPFSLKPNKCTFSWMQSRKSFCLHQKF